MKKLCDDVIFRTLDSNERRTWTNRQETPLVIEPTGRGSLGLLSEFLRTRSSEVLNALATHGAILLRRFEVTSPSDFESAVTSIRGMNCMRDILFAEAGRTLADGATAVFYTNKLIKTGGSMQFGMFHTENYFIPDVPRYICFWCETPCGLGGETGLVDVSKVYSELPSALKLRLEEHPCLVSLFPIRKFADDHQVPEQLVLRFCNSVGLTVATVKGEPYAAIYKPSVVLHPETQERSLFVNFFALPSLEASLLNAFLSDYSAPPWILHNMFWRIAWLRRFGAWLAARPTSRHDHDTIYVTNPAVALAGSKALTELFMGDEIQELATLMRRHYSSFLWQRGDVLLIDNLKLAHNGMPGRGRRELKVLLCNPVSIPYQPNGSGCYTATSSAESAVSLGSRFAMLSTSLRVRPFVAPIGR
jgi:alpha-ketoglutarate-dependent taurine dioxygenase